MLSIAIVDDEQVHRDILTKYIEEWKAREKLEAEVETFASGEAFDFAWSGEQRYDVLFLDIMMGATDGISLARRLREQGKKLDIIFTTGIADYMQEGYEVEAMHYLLKPLSKEKVWECLDKCLKRREEDAEWILLPTEEGLVKTDVSKILYGEAVGHYCVLECMGAKAGNQRAGEEAGRARGLPVLPPLLSGEPAEGIQGRQAGHRHGGRRAGAREPQDVQ